MLYIFDTSSLMVLFNFFYERRFPSLWERFNDLTSKGGIVSVREVAKEVESHQADDRLTKWVRAWPDLFQELTEAEAQCVKDIFNQPHFQALISRKKLLEGGHVADPFLIAKAKVLNGCVITQETYKPSAAKIPNVCEFFGVPCMDLEGFMEQENWVF